MQAIKAYKGKEVKLHSFLFSVLDGGKWLASCSGRITSGGKDPATHCIEGWVGPRNGLDGSEMRETSLPLTGLEYIPAQSVA
jgi:hypothetical protein